jgi:hypothetical protein
MTLIFHKKSPLNLKHAPINTQIRNKNQSKTSASQGCSCLCIVIPDKGAQRPLIRYPAPLSKGAAFCRYIFLNKEQNASRFGICAGFRLGARYRSLGRNDAESLGFGRNEQP